MFLCCSPSPEAPLILPPVTARAAPCPCPYAPPRLGPPQLTRRRTAWQGWEATCSRPLLRVRTPRLWNISFHLKSRPRHDNTVILAPGYQALHFDMIPLQGEKVHMFLIRCETVSAFQVYLEIFGMIY